MEDDILSSDIDPDILLFVRDYCDACNKGNAERKERAYGELVNRDMTDDAILYALRALDKETGGTPAQPTESIELTLQDLYKRMRAVLFS